MKLVLRMPGADDGGVPKSGCACSADDAGPGGGALGLGLLGIGLLGLRRRR